VHEKRAHGRTPISTFVACTSESGVTIAGTSRDISLGGMFIVASQQFPFGTKVTIAATLQGAGECKLPAIVRWTSKDGFGVQFGLLGARETHAIAKLIRPAK
jgi:Na+-driven multidrug efflux pump